MTKSKIAKAQGPSSPAVTTTPAANQPASRLATAPEILLSPSVQNAVAIDAWGQFAGKSDLAELIKGGRQGFERVNSGDLRMVESMLYGQAMTLQTMFTNLARRAANQEYLKQFEAHLTLALKAQAQCRATLVALAEIKNPHPVSFVKQANITNGPQQVNNGTPGNSAQYAQAHAHAGQNTGRENELLETPSHEMATRRDRHECAG